MTDPISFYCCCYNIEADYAIVFLRIDELQLVAIGPLTNLAVALRLDPEFGRRLKSCWIMGGNYLGKSIEILMYLYEYQVINIWTDVFNCQ